MFVSGGTHVLFGWALKRQCYKTVVEYMSSLSTAPVNTVMNLKSPLNDYEVSFVVERLLASKEGLCSFLISYILFPVALRPHSGSRLPLSGLRDHIHWTHYIR
jgi:hypothetical protein